MKPITYPQAAWNFLRGLKVLHGIDEVGLEASICPPGGFLDKDGNMRPSPSDAMDVHDFHGAVLKLCHQPIPEGRDERERAVMEIVGDVNLMSALEELARDLTGGSR